MEISHTLDACFILLEDVAIATHALLVHFTSVINDTLLTHEFVQFNVEITTFFSQVSGTSLQNMHKLFITVTRNVPH